MRRLSCSVVVFAGVLAVAGLAGCGQKGELYLPRDPAPVAPSSAIPATAPTAAPTAPPAPAAAPVAPTPVEPTTEQGDQHAA